MEIEWNDYQLSFVDWARTTCKANRIGFMKMLLDNLKIEKIHDIQNIAARFIKKRKYSTFVTAEYLSETEDGWYELPTSEKLMNWAGYTNQDVLVGYIKLLLPSYQKDEIQKLRSSWTYHAREKILHPDKIVSRHTSAPIQEGWWSRFSGRMLSVDCEMVAVVVGAKANGRPRCRNVAGMVSVVSHEGNVVYKATIKHHPLKVYLTQEMKKITGFTNYSFINGIDLGVVKEDLKQLFKKKLLIMIGAGTDFTALDMTKGNFEVFDVHQHYQKDTGNIGLRSLVYHYYGIDIQSGIHDPDLDAKFTMKIFLEKYIPDKLANGNEKFSRSTGRKFNEIITIN